MIFGRIFLGVYRFDVKKFPDFSRFSLDKIIKLTFYIENVYTKDLPMSCELIVNELFSKI